MEEFLKSRIGKKLIESDLPKLVEAINKLSTALSNYNKIEEKKLIFERKKLNEKNNYAGITRSSTDSEFTESEN